MVLSLALYYSASRCPWVHVDSHEPQIKDMPSLSGCRLISECTSGQLLLIKEGGVEAVGDALGDAHLPKTFSFVNRVSGHLIMSST